MKKSKEEQVQEFVTKIKNGEMTLEDVQKALQAGHEDLGQTDDTNIRVKAEREEELRLAEQEAIQNETQELEVQTEVQTEEAPVETPQPQEVKFAGGLFQEFSLGASLEQGPQGNALNLKHSQHQQTKTGDVVVTKED